MDGSASEREEGEISDDYEIISDESIDCLTAKKSGKFNSPAQELIRTISLSSVSDNYSEGEEKTVTASRKTSTKKYPRGHTHVKRRVCRKTWEKKRSSYPKPKRKKYSNDSDSESDSDIVNKSIKRQLKEAVTVADKRSEERCTNNLQTRLKRMINPNYSKSKSTLHDDDEEVQALRDIALLSTQKMEEEEMVNKSPVTDEKVNNSTDQELTELRIIALKSAFLKKHQNRKQKKENFDVPATEIAEEEIQITVEENTLKIVENHTPEPVAELQVIVEESTMEIVESHTPEPTAEIQAIIEESTLEIVENNEHSTVLNPLEAKKQVVQEEALICSTCSSVQVEALLEEKIVEEDAIKIVPETKDIISEKEALQNSIQEEKEDNNEGNEENIEEDEDIMRAMLLASMSKKITSETKNLSDKILKDTVNSVDNKVKNKLITILPTAPIKKIIININGESDSDSESLARTPTEKIKTDKNFDKNLSMLLKQARENVERDEDSTLDKSVVKLLPRSQQAEYKQLKHKLQILNARRKSATQKIKRSLQKSDDAPTKELVKKNILSMKKVNKPRMFTTKLQVNNVLKNKQLINAKIVTATFSQDPVPIQPKTVVQERLNQAKNRYEDLEPLMRQIDEVREKRDEEQAFVQNLLSQLKIARNRLSSVHQHFTSLVQKLVTAKADIDKWLVQY